MAGGTKLLQRLCEISRCQQDEIKKISKWIQFVVKELVGGYKIHR